MTGEITLKSRLGALSLDMEARVEPGVTAIFGPSGAGKTSVLRMVAGLDQPDHGRIEVAGEVWCDTDQRRHMPPHQRRLGYVFQEPRLFPHLSVAQNLRYGMSGSDGFDMMVALLGLSGLLGRKPAGLSGGEAQRAALGRALLTRPKLLLMDEPLSALDLGLKREILPYLERLKAETETPILYVSHDIDEVTRLADRVILLDAGRAEPAQPVAAALAGAAPGSRVGRAIAGGLLTAQIEGFHAGDNLTELRIGAQSLWLPGRVETPDGQVRLRVDARDVTLSLEAPTGLSALNILPVEVLAIDQGPGAGALVRLDHQGQALAAKLTMRSVRQLGLAPGTHGFAILKTMSVNQTQVVGAG